MSFTLAPAEERGAPAGGQTRPLEDLVASVLKELTGDGGCLHQKVYCF
jgi:hypothetical protein